MGAYKMMGKLVQEDEGAVMLEYAIMAAFIAAACAAAVGLLGGAVVNLLESVTSLF
jgi:Flp pilus assembly pilin Flp